MFSNKYSKLIVLRVIAIVFAVAIIVMASIKGSVYDLALRSEFSFFICKPTEFIQNIMFKYMAIVAYIAVIILNILAQVFSMNIYKGRDNSSSVVLDTGADFIGAVTGIFYLIATRNIGKCVPLPNAVDYIFFLVATGFFTLCFIFRFILATKFRKGFEHKTDRGERNSLIATLGFFFIVALVAVLGIVFSGQTDSDFGIYGSEKRKVNKEVEDSKLNSFCGAVSVGDKIYYTDTVLNLYDPSIYCIDKKGSKNLVDANHYITNSGFLCCNGTDIYYLSKDFKNWASETFVVKLNTKNNSTTEYRFTNIPVGYQICDNILGVRDGYLYFAMLYGNSTIEMWRAPLTDKPEFAQAEKYASNMFFLNNFDAYFEAIIHNSGMPDNRISYKDDNLFYRENSRCNGFSKLDANTQQLLSTFDRYHCSNLYVCKSDSEYRKEFQASLSTGNPIGEFAKSGKLISENVDLYNIRNNHVFYTVITSEGTDVYQADLNGENAVRLASFKDHLLCERLYVADTYIACYVKNDCYYQLFETENYADHVQKLEVINIQ